jgi:hypothetical protein
MRYVSLRRCCGEFLGRWRAKSFNRRDRRSGEIFLLKRISPNLLALLLKLLQAKNCLTASV